jgi:glycosyltransferase involved in cell wall biosynthesis
VTNVFAPADAPRAERYTVGYVGSLVERKGVDRLIHALAAMPTRRRPMLEIAGDGPERERLVGLARGLNVDVCWLGEIRPEDLPTVGVHWWVQVVPSRYDGWAVVVNEALGKGVPVIASDQVGAAHDLVRPTLTGRIFSDQAQLVAALDEFGDIDVSRAYGRRGRILAEGLAASRAADWLVDLADSRPADSRSFVDDAWTSAGVRF